MERSLLQVKAFVNDQQVSEWVVVVCSGTNRGVTHLENMLDRKGVIADVVNWRVLFDRLGVSW